jgi:hypothetical protein
METFEGLSITKINRTANLSIFYKKKIDYLEYMIINLRTD